MALVGVEHLGLDTQGVQGADPADAEQDLLAQAVLAPTAVQAVGDRPLGGPFSSTSESSSSSGARRPRPARSGR